MRGGEWQWWATEVNHLSTEIWTEGMKFHPWFYWTCWTNIGTRVQNCCCSLQVRWSKLLQAEATQITTQFWIDKSGKHKQGNFELGGSYNRRTDGILGHCYSHGHCETSGESAVLVARWKTSLARSLIKFLNIFIAMTLKLFLPKMILNN